MLHDAWHCKCEVCADLRTKADEPDRDLTGGSNPPLNKQEAQMRVVVADVWRRQLAEIEKGGTVDTSKPIQLALWNKELANEIEPVMVASFESGGNAGLRAARVEVPEWIEQPEAVEAVKRESFAFARKVNETTADSLKASFVEGVEQGETVQQLKKRARAVYAGFEASKRDLMIARTEHARATELGKDVAWQSSDAVTAKEWSAPGDSCPFCRAMDGKVIGLGRTYWKEGDEMKVDFKDRELRMTFGYADITAPPLHPNCRCALIPVID